MRLLISVSPSSGTGAHHPDPAETTGTASAGSTDRNPMTPSPAIDVHQHLWPPRADRRAPARSRAPRLVGWDLLLDGEPPYQVDPADHDPAGRRAWTSGGSCSGSPARWASRTCPQRRGCHCWRPGTKALRRCGPRSRRGRRSAGRIRTSPISPGGWRTGSSGCRSPRPGFPRPGPSRTSRRRSRWWPRRTVRCSSTPVQCRRVRARPQRPPISARRGGRRWSTTPVSCSTAWWSWHVAGRALFPQLRICFAAGAGLAPVHHERFLARSGRPLVVDRRTFVDTSSYGRQGIDSLIRVLGIDLLVLGSDRPYAAPLDIDLGAAASTAIRHTNPLLCWKEHRHDHHRRTPVRARPGCRPRAGCGLRASRRAGRGRRDRPCTARPGRGRRDRRTGGGRVGPGPGRRHPRRRVRQPAHLSLDNLPGRDLDQRSSSRSPSSVAAEPAVARGAHRVQRRQAALRQPASGHPRRRLAALLDPTERHRMARP